MKLKEEVKEAMAKALRAHDYPEHARQISVEPLVDVSDEMLGIAVGAALAVIDQYEEVEVEECRFRQDGLQMHVLRFCDSHSFGKGYGDPVSRTIYMRKPEPAPDVEELARRAVKAWRSSCGVPVCETMEALEKELDE